MPQLRVGALLRPLSAGQVMTHLSARWHLWCHPNPSTAIQSIWQERSASGEKPKKTRRAARARASSSSEPGGSDTGSSGESGGGGAPAGMQAQLQRARAAAGAARDILHFHPATRRDLRDVRVNRSQITRCFRSRFQGCATSARTSCPATQQYAWTLEMCVFWV